MNERKNRPIINRKKAKAVILYILNKSPCGIDEKALRSLLYLIDFGYYEIYEAHLMGFTYTKQREKSKEAIKWKFF